MSQVFLFYLLYLLYFLPFLLYFRVLFFVMLICSFLTVFLNSRFFLLIFLILNYIIYPILLFYFLIQHFRCNKVYHFYHMESHLPLSEVRSHLLLLLDYSSYDIYCSHLLFFRLFMDIRLLNSI